MANASVMVVASDVCYHTSSSRSLGELVGGIISQWNTADVKSETNSEDIAETGNKRGCRAVLSHTIRYSLGSEDNFDEPLYSFLLECDKRNLGIRVLRSVSSSSSSSDAGTTLTEGKACLQSPLEIAKVQQSASVVITIESV